MQSAEAAAAKFESEYGRMKRAAPGAAAVSSAEQTAAEAIANGEASAEAGEASGEASAAAAVKSAEAAAAKFESEYGRI